MCRNSQSLWIIALFSLSHLGVVAQTPEITDHPLSQIALEGDVLDVTVGVVSDSPISFTWTHNGEALSEVTGNQLRIDSVTLADRGWYHVEVRNDSGATTSVFHFEVGLPQAGLVRWGELYATYPAMLENIVTLSSANDSNLVLTLDASGRVMPLEQIGRPDALVPADLPVVVRIANNYGQSAAVTKDGRVIAWPSNGNLPTNLTDVVDVKLGRLYGLALIADGTVVSWGQNFNGQRDLPEDLTNVVAIAPGIGHGGALLANGTVRPWGNGESASTQPNGLTGVVALHSGNSHLVALQSDGTVIAWGTYYADANQVPLDLAPAAEVAAGGQFSLVRHRDETISTFGSNAQGQSDVPAWLNGATHIFTTFSSSGALVRPAQPTVEIAPQSQSLLLGDNLILTVAPRGALPLSLRWYHNGEPLANGDGVEGATGAELFVPNIDTSRAGDYTVELTNHFGTSNSMVATITVATPPAFNARPHTTLLPLGESATFDGTATGTGTVTYQWKHNGQHIPGADAETFSIDQATTTDRGFYEVIATDDIGSSSSVFHVHLAPANSGGALTLRSWGRDIFAGQSYGSARSTDVVKLVADGDRVLGLHGDGTLSA